MSSRDRKKAARNDKRKTNRASTSSSAQVSVETLENGFLINVCMEENSPSLLVQILEVFEELGLEVSDATVSCSDSFQLEAVGGENQGHNLDAQVVKQAVSQAIQKWSESNEKK